MKNEEKLTQDFRVLSICESFKDGIVYINAGKDVEPCWTSWEQMGQFLHDMSVAALAANSAPGQLFCMHDVRLNCHCDSCFTDSQGTNQRGMRVPAAEPQTPPSETPVNDATAKLYELLCQNIARRVQTHDGWLFACIYCGAQNSVERPNYFPHDETCKLTKADEIMVALRSSGIAAPPFESAQRRMTLLENIMRLPYIKATRNTEEGEQRFVCRDDVITRLHEFAKNERMDIGDFSLSEKLG